jgi:hypothetical protein
MLYNINGYLFNPFLYTIDSKNKGITTYTTPKEDFLPKKKIIIIKRYDLLRRRRRRKNESPP